VLVVYVDVFAHDGMIGPIFLMRYYFDLHDDVFSAEDKDGVDLPSVENARQKAIDIARSVARDLFNANGSNVLVTVRNDTKPLFALTVFG
jgi:hypothetical protein